MLGAPARAARHGRVPDELPRGRLPGRARPARRGRSEELEPGDGWPYAEILADLRANPGMDGAGARPRRSSSATSSPTRTREDQWPVTMCAVHSARASTRSRGAGRLHDALRDAIDGDEDDANRLMRAHVRSVAFDGDLVDLRVVLRAGRHEPLDSAVKDAAKEVARRAGARRRVRDRRRPPGRQGRAVRRRDRVLPGADRKHLAVLQGPALRPAPRVGRVPALLPARGAAVRDRLRLLRRLARARAGGCARPATCGSRGGVRVTVAPGARVLLGPGARGWARAAGSRPSAGRSRVGAGATWASGPSSSRTRAWRPASAPCRRLGGDRGRRADVRRSRASGPADSRCVARRSRSARAPCSGRTRRGAGRGVAAGAVVEPYAVVAGTAARRRRRRRRGVEPEAARPVWRPTSMPLRPAQAADAPAITRIFQAARAHSLACLPIVHSDAEDYAFFARTVAARGRDRGGVPAARSSRSSRSASEEIEHLYVDPRHQRQGRGAALLAHAQGARAHLELWVFQRNTGAIAFYKCTWLRDRQGH